MFGTVGVVLAGVVVAGWWLTSRAAAGMFLARAVCGEGTLAEALRESRRLLAGRRRALFASRMIVLGASLAAIASIEALAWIAAEAMPVILVDLAAAAVMLGAPFLIGSYTATLLALVEARVSQVSDLVDAGAIARAFE